ncbi:MAG: universal stress protein [Methanobacteriaceae archaeon]|jgi:nucleotide-binding universal stress UspA family protein|nr:universal stress protein [Methanobacteriaceae archaeon]
MYKKILLPTDGSENAQRAGKHAISIADTYRADIIVLNVIDTYYVQSLALPNFREDLRAELRLEGKKAVKKFVDQLEESQCNGYCKNINLTTKIKDGKPHQVILETILEEGIDLVVMGASGRHGLDRVMIGSVTDRVIREAKCPVMVVS